MTETRGHGPLLVDSHCHLDLEQFEEDRDEVVDRARQNGVRLIVNPGIDLNHCQRALELADRYAEVYAAVGFHPNSSDQYDSSKWANLRALAAHPKVVAIGEIGLDYYWDKVDPLQQATAFREQLDLAAELGLPVIIHSRDAGEDVAAILEAWIDSSWFQRSSLAGRPFAGVLHAFGGDLAMAQRAYAWRFVLSLGGPVTYKNARALHTLVPQLRLDCLMLETDAPYLTPHPHRGERNEPGYVALVAAQMADLYGRSIAEIAAETSAVALRFYGLEALEESEQLVIKLADRE
jgi:TatD DNase family protein